MDFQYIINRFKELSTWQGLITIATAFSASIDPDKALQYATAGAAIFGVIGTIFPDKASKTTPQK